jgi:CrcB protein
MYRIILIFAGGGIGSVLRHFIQGWAHRPGVALPLGTMVVNITGCFLIGLLGGMFFGPRPINDDWRFAILTGILGGYTTFSTFGWETLRLGEDREFLLAGLNVAISVVVGLGAVWLGRQLVHHKYGS